MKLKGVQDDQFNVAGTRSAWYVVMGDWNVNLRDVNHFLS